MFESDMHEGINHCIKIADHEPRIVKALVQFIYTGSVPVKREELVPLMMLADKYEVESLCLLCANMLIEQIDKDVITGVIKNIRPFADRESFKPIIVKLRDILVQKKDLLDIVITSL